MTTTLPNILNVSDPSLGFVFVPGPQAGRVALTLPDPNLEMPSTMKWNIGFDRAMPWSSTLRIMYQGNHNDKRLRYAQGNLPQSPLDGPITVVNHPNNAPAAGFPDLRGKVIDRIAADALCAGTGFFNLAVDGRLPERRADRRQRDQLARAADERAAARSALHDQPADQQRRRELV